jgi:hypothetical protein
VRLTNAQILNNKKQTMNENYKINLLIAILEKQIATFQDKESFTYQTLLLVLKLANDIKNQTTLLQ